MGRNVLSGELGVKGWRSGNGVKSPGGLMLLLLLLLLLPAELNDWPISPHYQSALLVLEKDEKQTEPAILFVLVLIDILRAAALRHCRAIGAFCRRVILVEDRSSNIYEMRRMVTTLAGYSSVND